MTELSGENLNAQAQIRELQRGGEAQSEDRIQEILQELQRAEGDVEMTEGADPEITEEEQEQHQEEEDSGDEEFEEVGNADELEPEPEAEAEPPPETCASFIRVPSDQGDAFIRLKKLDIQENKDNEAFKSRPLEYVTKKWSDQVR